MTNYAKVKEHKELIRDMHSKAILNIDEQSLLEHRKKKSMMKEIVNNSQKINQIENDISEIKQILFSLSDKFKV
jgi:flagellar basal body-associated protein FliL